MTYYSSRSYNNGIRRYNSYRQNRFLNESFDLSQLETNITYKEAKAQVESFGISFDELVNAFNDAIDNYLASNRIGKCTLLASNTDNPELETAKFVSLYKIWKYINKSLIQFVTQCGLSPDIVGSNKGKLFDQTANINLYEYFYKAFIEKYLEKNGFVAIIPVRYYFIKGSGTCPDARNMAGTLSMEEAQERIGRQTAKNIVYTVSIPYYISDSQVDLEENGRYKNYQSALEYAKAYVEDYYNDDSDMFYDETKEIYNPLFIFDYVNNITYYYDILNGWIKKKGIHIDDDGVYDTNWEDYLGCCVIDSLQINESRKYRKMRRLNESIMEPQKFVMDVPRYGRYKVIVNDEGIKFAEENENYWRYLYKTSNPTSEIILDTRFDRDRIGIAIMEKIKGVEFVRTERIPLYMEDYDGREYRAGVITQEIWRVKQ